MERHFPESRNDELHRDSGLLYFLEMGNKGQELTATFKAMLNLTITFGALTGKTYGDPAFTVSATASSGLVVSFSSQTPSSCSTSGGNGTTVTIVAPGTCTIRASQAGNLTYNAAPNVDRSFTINKGNPVITWANPADITYPTTLSGTQLNATADVPGSFAYTPASGTVLNAGSNQDLRVDFTPSDTANYNSAFKIVKINVNKGNPVITWANPADITYPTTLSGTQLNATADVPGSFAYTPALGTVLDAGSNQDLRVDFTPSDTANYNSAFKIVKINVNKGNPVITWANPADITYPTTLSGTQLNATTDVPGSFAYTPASGTVLNAGSNQDLRVDFTPTDAANYNSAFKIVKINVNKGNPVITWANPADITYPTTLSGTQLNVTADVPGSFAYTPASGHVLNAGTNQDLRVDFTPTDAANYNSAFKIVKINVNKGNPVITWANPADITYPTTLSGTQLNATADVPGSFAYTRLPATCSTLVPTRTCEWTLLPGDTANYNSAFKIVKINVNKGNPVITWANPAEITYPTALSGTQLNATADVAGSFVYSPVSGSMVNAGINQDLRVDFTPTDAANYNSAFKIVKINVNKANQTVFVTQSAVSAAMYNTNFNVAATGGASGNPVVITTSGACIVNSGGNNSATILMISGIGVCTVEFKQVGNANYHEAPLVTQVTKAIAWTLQASISP